MSIADFVLAFVGIIIGLGVADLLISLHKLLRAGRRVKWHWAYPVPRDTHAVGHPDTLVVEFSLV